MLGFSDLQQYVPRDSVGSRWRPSGPRLCRYSKVPTVEMVGGREKVNTDMRRSNCKEASVSISIVREVINKTKSDPYTSEGEFERIPASRVSN